MADEQTTASEFDVNLWRLASVQMFTSLSAAVALSQPATRSQITVAVVLSDGLDPIDAMEGNSFVSLPQIQSGLARLLWSADDRGDFVLSSWKTSEEGIYLLVASVPITDKRWEKVEKWTRRASPRLSYCFLNHDDFISIGSSLSKYGDVELSRLTAHNVIDQSSYQRGWKERQGTLRPSHYEGIAEVEREGASVRTMSLVVRHRISLHLRRIAGATYYWGSIAIFENEVVVGLVKAAAQRRRLLADRQRPPQEPPKAPLSLRLAAPLFAEDLPATTVISVLQKLADTNVAVLHRNPYLHVAVTDTADGSNFDLFVTSDDSIEIFAGYRATPGALSRLSQELGDRFQVKEILEARPAKRVTLDDLFVSD